ncbi:tRNA pseudouridine(55) synthase TruB [Kovacikia minuta CCNUW1]|uniref:tRNA pseudouridine(55) synthase TruB n=1 Tax=Kovacikia minuta TaxID=2931930 RepID=UPI001CCA1BC1|nr:tRNA pseudouridine(55) synthase TruB [Kovacikia minuta]UBF29245.1 tRNA pseudouridine(55) synthase TruB [Kovacikia minuta CCNUW1]
MHGFLNLNKSPGFTSHDCVAKVRRLLKFKRVGHAGTLDPAATGVLPIALGRATRLLQFLRQDKAYRATVRFGLSTTTDDLEGEVLHSQAVPELNWETVEVALRQFQGVIQQVPPNYSAIQVGGKRLYDLARSGKEIVVQPRQVEVFTIDVLDWRPGDFPELDLAIACGPGTYIRSIARDLGRAIHTGGTLANLMRTASSGFNLEDSLTLEDLEAQLQQGTFQPLALESALGHLPTIALPEAIARRWCQGQRILWNHELPLQTLETKKSAADTALVPTTMQVHHENGQFLGIGQSVNTETGKILIPKIVFEGS